MRILVTNDDGLHAQQLIPLIRWARKLGEVTAFVPKVEQSGKSHSFNIKEPFEAVQVQLAPDITVWSVDSSPADCVRLAVLGMNMEFDLVLSGINRGLNVGADIMYSGTVAAASEAVNLGIPAIALSTTPENYPNATDNLDEIFALIEKLQLLKKHNFYNINIPKDAKGFCFTQQGGPYFSDDFLPEPGNMIRPRGKSVWIDSGRKELDTDATLTGFISISPLTINRTAWDVLGQLRG